jgi:FkbM family methyltransferase
MVKDIYDWIAEIMSINPNPVIFELGANIGSDTVRLAKIKASTIHAFEPEPRCDLSGMPGNVIINKMAVCDKNGIATFHMSDSPGHVWTYSSSLLPPKNHLTAHDYVQFERDVQVITVRLDDYCQWNNINSIDLLWMDVQGAEHKVFAGATNILQRTKYIYTEYSDYEMYEGQVRLVKLLDMLDTFDIVDIWSKEPSNVLLKNRTYINKLTK